MHSKMIRYRGETMLRCIPMVSIAALVLWAAPVGAQQTLGPDQPLRIVITKTDCSRLMRHTPSPDVAYRPGEGANGRKVAPADIPGSGAEAMGNMLPEVLEIPLMVKPLQGKAYATHGVDDSNMALGTVRYDVARGTFTYNGEPLGSTEQQELARACAKRGVR